MHEFVARSDITLARAPGQRIISGDAYLTYLDGEQIRQAAEEEAQAIRQAAEEEAQAILDQVREQGGAELREAYLEQLMDFIDGAIAHLAGLEQHLTRTLGDAMKQLIGEQIPEERIRNLVDRMIRGVDVHERILLKVSHTDYSHTEKALVEVKQQWPRFAVCTSDEVEPGRLVLECNLGVVEASLSDQITAFRNTVTRRLSGDDPEANDDHPEATFESG